MNISDEVIDKKITETACQAFGLIRNTAKEINKDSEWFYMRKMIAIVCKLYDPGAELKN